MSNQRLYRLRTSGSDNGVASWHTGRTTDGRQLIIISSAKELLAFCFNSTGSFLEVRTKPLPDWMLSDRPKYVYSEAEAGETIQWRTELGVIPGPIEVEAFWVGDIGIRLLSRNFEKYIENPFDEPTDERERTIRMLEGWDADGDFVFHYGNDYFIDGRDGHVASS